MLCMLCMLCMHSTFHQQGHFAKYLLTGIHILPYAVLELWSKCELNWEQMFLWIIFSGYNIIYGQEAKRIVSDHMAQLLGFQKIYSEKNSLIILQVACKMEWETKQSYLVLANSYEIQTLQSPEDISSFFWGSQRELEFYIPDKMKLTTEFSLVTWPRLVKFTELKISKYQF